MGVDTVFYKSVNLFYVDDDDDAVDIYEALNELDISEAWNEFKNLGFFNEGEQTDLAWDLIDGELTPCDDFRTTPIFWAECFLHIYQGFLKPNNISWYPIAIPWFCTWGDHSSGVLHIGSDQIKIITVDGDDGTITTELISLDN